MSMHVISRNVKKDFIIYEGQPSHVVGHEIPERQIFVCSGKYLPLFLFIKTRTCRSWDGA